VTSSAFQELFAQRAQGFQIDFRFRNAPPRPPVGPCFVGNSLDAVLAEQSRQYKPHNAVEANHTWKLHTEADLGVPLAPSAIGKRSYERPDEKTHIPLHPDDEALLNWTGSMGDTAAEQRKIQQEQARAAARLAMSTTAAMTRSPAIKAASADQGKKKIFSRVLKEDMQTWMKKTTYLSNDYSRKVHDFKSLAQTKSELVSDLQAKQMEMAQQRSVEAVVDSFRVPLESDLVHPSNSERKPVRVLPLLPDVAHWGRAFTHVVMDKAPTTLPPGHWVGVDYPRALVTHVEPARSSAASGKMTCHLIAPEEEEKEETTIYRAIQSYDLDVVPLKEEDSPHMNFCIRLDKTQNVAFYLPIASRVQLTMGRPSKLTTLQPVQRRPLTDQEISDMEERMAEIDQELAEKHHISKSRKVKAPVTASVVRETPPSQAKEDDGEGDFGDDDDDDDEEEEQVFGGATKTIVAES
jgi:Fe-S cluster biosynthesis and repair protein YggX